jgi:hypothetical protein
LEYRQLLLPCRSSTALWLWCFFSMDGSSPNSTLIDCWGMQRTAESCTTRSALKRA